MSGQPAEQRQAASPSLEQLGSDVRRDLKVYPSWSTSWPSFMWSSEAMDNTESGMTPEGADGKLFSRFFLVSPNSLHYHSEHLDLKALRLLLAQKELEIQGLRKAAQCQAGKRMACILHELTDSKTERTSSDQVRTLQQQIEKMNQELRGQKERARQEKMELENQLQEAQKSLQCLEDELQSFRRSCLLQLARTSWAGRVLRSQTGSVEVVTAETLMMDVSDESLEQSSPEGRHFRLEDVDWNSIARQYPNLFEDIHSYNRPTSTHALDSPGSLTPPRDKSYSSKKSVDWSLLPQASFSVTTTITEGDSTSQSSMPSSLGSDSSPPLTQRSPEQEGSGSGDRGGPGLPLTAAPWTGALPTLELRRPKAYVDSGSSLGAAVPGIGLARPGSVSSSLPDQGGMKAFGSSLKIVKIDKHGKFIRVLNESLEESVDISGFVLKQLIHHFPVCVYRFPKDTLLGPQHHITVWGEGVSMARKPMTQALQRELIHFYTNPGCVTLLLNPIGQVMSEYQARHCVTEASKSFTDHTDISIDCYPLLERERSPEALSLESKSHRQNSQARKKTKVPGPPQGLEVQPGPPRGRCLNPIPCINIAKPSNQWDGKEAEAHKESLHSILVALPSSPELVQLPNVVKMQQGKCIPGANQFLRPRICRKFVDVACPMVALSVQKTAESRFGRKHLSGPPFTKELREPL